MPRLTPEEQRIISEINNVLDPADDYFEQGERAAEAGPPVEKDPFTDERDSLGFAPADYANAVKVINKEMNAFGSARIRESLHQELMLFGGVPKEYNTLYVTVANTAEALVLYLLTAGYVTVTDKGTASAEEQEETFTKRKARVAEQMGWDKPEKAEPVGPARFKPGAYL